MKNDTRIPDPLLPTPRDPASIQAMFNDIAPTYDALNHFLSFGMDILWRRKALRLLKEKRGGAFLDIASGSGDLALDALRLSPRTIVASDFAVRMLKVLEEKKARRSGGTNITLVACDAMHLPFSPGSFDATMVAFGIRNFADRPAALREMVRVLKPGGLSLLLELTTPRAPLIAQLYAFYGRFILPLLGAIISRHRSAYRYLPDSIARFPSQEEFTSMMRKAGFAEARAHRLTFGIATIFVGRKGM